MSFAPQQSLPSRAITQEQALQHIQTYLALTKSAPYLLPNARLEPSGPTAGSSGHVTIRNLERVEAGLRGESLAPSLDIFAPTSAEENGEGIVGEGNGEEMEWQDKDEFEREQDDIEGEIMPEQTIIAQGNEKLVNGTVEEGSGKKRKFIGEEGAKDKAARKAEKKMRLKEDQKMRAAEALKRKSGDE